MEGVLPVAACSKIRNGFVPPKPVEKKTDSLYFQKNATQKDPNVWMNLWSSTRARTPVQSKAFEQEEWDFDTLLKVMHRHP